MSGKAEMTEKPQGAKPSRSRTTSAAVAREIDENLKRALTQEVPDRFAQLLAQLREKEGKA
jgi:Anti-sigma factor NepR